MKLTIINDDDAVYVDGISLLKLDLSNTGIPDNVHALQWKNNLGWIEYVDNSDGTKPQNEIINQIPQWANNCITVYENKIRELQEEKNKLIETAKTTQPQTTGTQTL